MTDRFELDPRLDGDSLPLAELELSTLRLMKDANYPWLVMVPKRAGAVELIDLSVGDRAMLMEEIASVSSALKAVTGCDKLNVAQLGNMVFQLHIHVVARFKGDAAWPGPIWGKVPAKDYAPGEAEEIITRISTALE